MATKKSGTKAKPVKAKKKRLSVKKQTVGSSGGSKAASRSITRSRSRGRARAAE